MAPFLQTIKMKYEITIQTPAADIRGFCIEIFVEVLWGSLDKFSDNRYK